MTVEKGAGSGQNLGGGMGGESRPRGGVTSGAGWGRQEGRGARPRGRGSLQSKALLSPVTDFFSCPFPDLNLYLFCGVSQSPGLSRPSVKM